MVESKLIVKLCIIDRRKTCIPMLSTSEEISDKLMNQLLKLTKLGIGIYFVSETEMYPIVDEQEYNKILDEDNWYSRKEVR